MVSQEGEEEAGAGLGLPAFGGEDGGGDAQSTPLLSAKEEAPAARPQEEEVRQASRKAKRPTVFERMVMIGAEHVAPVLHEAVAISQRVWTKHGRPTVQGIIAWPVLAHVVLAVLLTWLLGRLHFNVLLVVTWMVAFLWQIHVKHLERERISIRADLLKEQLVGESAPDEETVRWLNAALERAWPQWLERVVSLKAVPLLAPWFLQTYKPGVLTKLDLKSVNMGSRPPMVTSARVYQHASRDNHLDIEMSVEIASANDMFMEFVAKVGSAGWAGLGLIPWTAYATDLNLVGRMRVGVQFSRNLPFVRRLEVAFVYEPQLSLAIKVMGLGLGKGFDAGGLPLVASYVDATLKRALRGSIVAPNKLVIEDMALLAKALLSDFSPEDPLTLSGGRSAAAIIPPTADSGDRSSPPTKPSQAEAFVVLEILEAEQLLAADSNGFSDPYVKGQLGLCKFVTSIKRTTLNPKWLEEFRVPVPQWEEKVVLRLHVRDYDKFTSDDDLGTCEIDVAKLRDRHRHDMWIKLSGVKTGSLHLAVTVLEEEDGDNVEKGVQQGETADGQPATFHTSTVTKETGDVVAATVTLKTPNVLTSAAEIGNAPPPSGPPPSSKLPPSETQLRRRAVHLNESSYKVAPGCVVVAWDM